MTVGNRGNTYLKKVIFSSNNETTRSQGAIGANADAKAGDINAITLVEQHTTPLAKAEVPDIVVDIDDTNEDRFVLFRVFVSLVFSLQ